MTAASVRKNSGDLDYTLSLVDPLSSPLVQSMLQGVLRLFALVLLDCSHYITWKLLSSPGWQQRHLLHSQKNPESTVRLLSTVPSLSKLHERDVPSFAQHSHKVD